MGLTGIRRAGLLLELFILAVLLGGRSSSSSLPGALYVLAGTYPGLVSLSLATSLRIKLRKSDPGPAAWKLHTRAYILLLSGWQVAIIGVLNMWPFGLSKSQISATIGYLLAAVFMVLSYKLVAIADSSEQEGGGRPISYFGRPRSRRIFLCAFVYTPVIPLIMMSVGWSSLNWCPTLLKIPQVLLLLVTSLSAVSAGLIFQRYRNVERDATRVGRILARVTLLLLGLATSVQIMLRYDLYMYVLSSITLLCTAATVHWLWLARERSLPLT